MVPKSQQDWKGTKRVGTLFMEEIIIATFIYFALLMYEVFHQNHTEHCSTRRPIFLNSVALLNALSWEISVKKVLQDFLYLEDFMAE